MEDLIEKLIQEIDDAKAFGEDPDEISWGREVGILITANEAKLIVKSLQHLNKKLQTGRLKCLASPCPCTAVKTNKCNDWCRFYQHTDEL